MGPSGGVCATCGVQIGDCRRASCCWGAKLLPICRNPSLASSNTHALFATIRPSFLPSHPQCLNVLDCFQGFCISKSSPLPYLPLPQGAHLGPSAAETAQGFQQPSIPQVMQTGRGRHPPSVRLRAPPSSAPSKPHASLYVKGLTLKAPEDKREYPHHHPPWQQACGEVDKRVAALQ